MYVFTCNDCGAILRYETYWNDGYGPEAADIKNSKTTEREADLVKQPDVPERSARKDEQTIIFKRPASDAENTTSRERANFKQDTGFTERKNLSELTEKTKVHERANEGKQTATPERAIYRVHPIMSKRLALTIITIIAFIAIMAIKLRKRQDDSDLLLR